jgi:hypothetical protein
MGNDNNSSWKRMSLLVLQVDDDIIYDFFKIRST